ncbi:ABC transporter substrate-binding protein [Cellulosilyticum sp. ST5]|uniref:ABC transporter substrate-binding protein n=1 Tax=Cellulosilyticum sp. ST5 TaxID=3055805 RepID=UPI0039774C60
MKKIMKVFVLIMGIIVLTMPAYCEEVSTQLPPIKLTWYFVGNGQEKDTALVETAINEYIAKNTTLNCSIKLRCYDWTNYDKKMQQMINSAEEFDICFTSNWSNNYYIRASQGAFISLDSLLPTYAPKTTILLGEDYLKGTYVNGSCYAIPSNKEKATQYGLLIRKDLVQKYNMDSSKVKKLEDMEPFFEIIKKKEPSMYVLDPRSVEAPSEMLNMRSLGCEVTSQTSTWIGGVYYDTKDYKVINQLETPEMIAYMKLMQSYVQKGFISKEVAEGGNYVIDEMYGKIFCSLTELYPGKAYYAEARSGYEYISIPLTKAVMSTKNSTGAMQAISATSNNPERALMFLELVNTDKALNNLLNFGIEGKHYIKVKGKTNIIQAGEEERAYNPGLGWAFGNQMLNYAFNERENQFINEMQSFNEQAQIDKTIGFVFNPDPVYTQIENCNLIWEKQVRPILLGAGDVTTDLPRAKKALKAAGVDDIISEMQKQLNAWKMKNKINN